jgi:hypothetical protein
MKIKVPHYTLLVSLLALFAGSISILAQDSEPDPLLNVRVVSVKIGHTNDWVDLQRELKEASEKVGERRGRSVYQEVKGDHSVFRILSSYENWADFGNGGGGLAESLGEARGATWANEVGDTIQARSELVSRMMADLDISAAEDYKPNLVMLRQITVKPGQAGAYRTWLREKLVPGLRKAGAQGRHFGNVVRGGNINQFYIAIHHADWASMDAEGALSKLSDEERSSIFGGSNDIVAETNVILMRFREDLSYEGSE